MTLETRPIRVLLADDNITMLWGLGKLVQGEFPRMTLIGTARTDSEALVYAGLRPHVIVLDLDLDGCSSLEIIPALKRRSGGGVLVHTGVSDRRLHEDAALFGAAGIVAKDAPAAELLDAVAAVHAGRHWGCDPSAVTPPDAGRIAGADLSRLTPAEIGVVADLVERWRLPVPDARRMPALVADIVATYDKLGVRNRLELAHVAQAHEAVRPDRAVLE